MHDGRRASHRDRHIKTVIIAAGRGSRLQDNTDDRPKTLLPLGETTILGAIIDNFRAAGSSDLVLVSGYHADQISAFAARPAAGTRIEVVFNADWKRGNGLSVHSARQAVGNEPFLLSMSDHLVSATALRAMIEAPSDIPLLLVDDRIADVFDIDDATKVHVRQDRVVSIGKDLAHYNAVDCGIFRLDGRFFIAMERALENGCESISDAMREIIASCGLGAVRMPSDAEWIDIDTPEAYAHAQARQAAAPA